MAQGYNLGTVLLLLASCTLVAGCASTYQGYGHSGVIVDESGIDMNQFNADLRQCQQYASAVPKAERTASTSIQGAVVGGAVGAIYNGSRGAGHGAATGAIAGGVKGATSAESEKQQVLRNCLRYKGYRVLN